MATLTTERPQPKPKPRLENGDRMKQPEFHRLYLETPDDVWAELVDGVVHVASPIRAGFHGKPMGRFLGWVCNYEAMTPGLDYAGDSTLILDDRNEYRPDTQSFIPKSKGGRAWINEDDYIVGSPDLVVEIAASSRSYDLGPKKEAYGRNGIREYIVHRVIDEAIDWFELVEGEYVAREPDADGVFRSKAFPGLWLHRDAMQSLRMKEVLEVLNQGLASPEHAAFAANLSA